MMKHTKFFSAPIRFCYEFRFLFRPMMIWTNQLKHILELGSSMYFKTLLYKPKVWLHIFGANMYRHYIILIWVETYRLDVFCTNYFYLQLLSCWCMLTYSMRLGMKQTIKFWTSNFPNIKGSIFRTFEVHQRFLNFSKNLWVPKI